MQFQVPQFIEVEDKIIGPLTFKQFLYIGGGLGGAYAFSRMFPLYVSAPLMAGIVALGAALAFYKYNERPFINALESAFYYFIGTKLYLWKKERNRAKAQENIAVADKPLSYVPKLSESRLRDLSWSLDIQDRISGGTASRTDRSASQARLMHTSQEAMVR